MARLLFEQLTGDRRRLELSDHAAPFGRPHKDPVATDAVELREVEVFCAGNNIPTRHIFGTKHPDWEFNGRFSDYWGGQGFARAKAAEVKRFVAEGRPVRVTWGAILSARGLIKGFYPSRESEREVEWRLIVAIDSDDFLQKKLNFPNRNKIAYDGVAQIRMWAQQIQLRSETIRLKGSIFDTLQSVVSTLALATATLVDYANQFESFERETIATIRRFRGMLGQIKTAAITVRDTVDAWQVDLTIEKNNADERWKMAEGQALIADSSLSIIQKAADMDRQAALTERGRTQAIYTAAEGDTFESISTQFYGSPDRAEDIREANGTDAGTQPTAGELYAIPV